MLVVWRGFGWLVPVVVFAALVLSQLSVDSLYGEGFYTANTWPKQAAFILGAIAVGLLGFILNHVKRQILVDEETGEVLFEAAQPLNEEALTLLAMPNPASGQTIVRLRGRADKAAVGAVEMLVYDLAGRHVVTLMAGTLPAGDHGVTWDGRDEAGRAAPAGVYLYRLTADGFQESKRMVLLK